MLSVSRVCLSTVFSVLVFEPVPLPCDDVEVVVSDSDEPDVLPFVVCVRLSVLVLLSCPLPVVESLPLLAVVVFVACVKYLWFCTSVKPFCGVSENRLVPFTCIP